LNLNPVQKYLKNGIETNILAQKAISNDQIKNEFSGNISSAFNALFFRFNRSEENQNPASFFKRQLFGCIGVNPKKILNL
jgi:hypothetical protein